jgi:hypothetical protein
LKLKKLLHGTENSGFCPIGFKGVLSAVFIFKPPKKLKNTGTQVFSGYSERRHSFCYIADKNKTRCQSAPKNKGNE